MLAQGSATAVFGALMKKLGYRSKKGWILLSELLGRRERGKVGSLAAESLYKP